MNQYSNSATRQLINLGGEFAHWVRDCVAALVDDLAGAPTSMTENQPMIFVGEDGLEIHHGKAGNEQNSVVRFNGPLHKLNAVLDGKANAITEMVKSAKEDTTANTVEVIAEAAAE